MNLSTLPVPAAYTASSGPLQPCFGKIPEHSIFFSLSYYFYSTSSLSVSASAEQQELRRCMAPDAPVVALSRPLFISSSMQLQSDRKDSMVNDSHGLESDADHYWQPKYETQELAVDHPTFTPTNPFYSSEPAYSQQEATNPTHSSALQHEHWTFDHSAAAGTPVHFDYSPVTNLEPSGFHHEQSDRVQPSFTSIKQIHDMSDSGPCTGYHHIKRALSPSPGPDWMAFAEQDSLGHASSIPKRIRVPHSRHSSSAADCLRSDMARKKNTKIDIPSERNLHNIDRLIEESTNETERKELKSQRRLLRNREAALASRQRKKKHTEELESKERDFSNRVRYLESRIHDLDCALINAEQDKQHLIQQNIEARNVIQGMHLDREEMIMNHTRETAALRHQLQSPEQREDSAAPIMSAAPSSSGCNEVTTNLDALSVNGQAWNCFSRTPDQQEMQYRHQNPHTEQAGNQDKQESSTAVIKPSQHGEQPVASSVLFMLLLYGAFVASLPSSRSLLPRLPDEVKAASSTVLETLLAEHNGITMTGQASLHMHTSASIENAPSVSATEWQGRAGQPQGTPEHLPRSMTTPVATSEQLSSVLPCGYHSMTCHDCYGMCGEAAVMPRTYPSNLAEALCALHTEKAAQGHHVDIYTRSLLWYRIPVDVIDQFKGIIQESRRLDE